MYVTFPFVRLFADPFVFQGDYRRYPEEMGMNGTTYCLLLEQGLRKDRNIDLDYFALLRP